jgi:uncharacterized protein YkuJ
MFLQRAAEAEALLTCSVSEAAERTRELELAHANIRSLQTNCHIKDDLLNQSQASIDLLTATQTPLMQKVNLLENEVIGKENELCRALQQLKTLEEDRKELTLKLEQTRIQDREYASISTRLNALEKANADLKLQLDFERNLIDTLRQQVSEEQEQVVMLQKQLSREKEQVERVCFVVVQERVVCLTLLRTPRFSLRSTCVEKFAARNSFDCAPQNGGMMYSALSLL